MNGTEHRVVNRDSAASSNPLDEAADAQPDDSVLVARCRGGDVDAYGELVRRHRQRIFQLAYSMLRNEADASDVTQEAFIRAWQGLRRFHGRALFSTWLYRITTNLCIDLARRKERRPTVTLADHIGPDTAVGSAQAPSANPNPAQEVQRRELAGRIDAALAKLSPEHRAVIHLREFEGLQYAEIARVVGCSIGTVMSRLHYARKNLQKLLTDNP